MRVPKTTGPDPHAPAAAPRSAWASSGFAALAVFAAGDLVAAMFPCDPGCRPQAGRLGAAGHVAAGLALLGLLSLSPDSPVVGLSQRVLELSVLGWASACGVYLARAERRGLGRPLRGERP